MDTTWSRLFFRCRLLLMLSPPCVSSSADNDQCPRPPRTRPVLLASGLHPYTVCWTAPLFFGVAHVHHAAQSLREGKKLLNVAVQTTFQLIYTTLFGAYASYAYIQTKSTTAIALAHGFCNWMGLPNFLFFQKQHILNDHRRELLFAHLIGLACFSTALVQGFLCSSENM